MTRNLRLDRGDGVALAYDLVPGRGPTVVFLPGFHSDMAGVKAIHTLAFCEQRGRAMLRLDYSGHGESGGAFTEGSIGRWCADALAVIDAVTTGEVLLVGSSMGGWIGLLIALARPGRVVGLVGIAAAPDFTERLMWQAMAPAERLLLEREGRITHPSEYGEALVITHELIADGRRHLLLDAPIALDMPVRLLQGQRDADVPWETAVTLAERLTGADVRVVLVKDGDHRLSRPADLALLGQILGGLLGEDGA